MARRSSAPPPAAKRPANIPAPKLPDAVRKLERRLADFKSADISKLPREEIYNLAERLCNNLSATLIDVFGHETIDAERVEMSADTFTPGVYSYLAETPHHEYVAAFESGRKQAISRLEAELSMLRERLEDDSDDGVARTLRAYEGLALHPDIEGAASKLFHGGHYANAIEDAVKALNRLVKYKSGRDDLDGVTLMQHAFSPKSPILRFNDLKTDSDREEQTGFMQLFCGAVTGLRNPRAHDLINDDPERALEFIAFISLLAKLADQARK